MRSVDMPNAAATQFTVDPDKLDLLSERESTLLAMAAQGFLDKEIASELDLSLNTLRTYWNRIRLKLGAGSRVALTGAYLERQMKRETPLAGGEPAVWEIDLRAWTIRFFEPWLSAVVGFELLEPGDLELALARYHRDDQPKVRALLSSVLEGYMSSFAYMARLVTQQGLTMTSSYVEVVRNDAGTAELLRGRPVPVMDLAQSSFGDFAIGHYRRDFRTGEVWADEGCRSIYRIPDSETDIRAALLRRYHPDDVDRAGAYIAEMIERQESSARRSYRLKGDEDRYHWVSAEVHITYDANGPVVAKMTVMAYK